MKRPGIGSSMLLTIILFLSILLLSIYSEKGSVSASFDLASKNKVTEAKGCLSFSHTDS